jgi:hypothetical protein
VGAIVKNFVFVDKVDRMVQKAEASMQVQKFLVTELRDNTANTEDQVEKFKKAAEAYMIKQIVKVKIKYY